MLRSKLDYHGPDLEEIAGHLPFLTSLDVHHSILPASVIRMMTQEQFLPKLASLRVAVACMDMEAFIDMLKTRWARSVVQQQQQQPGVTSYMICYCEINLSGANKESMSSLSSRILQIQEETGVSGVEIDLELAAT